MCGLSLLPHVGAPGTKDLGGQQLGRSSCLVLDPPLGPAAPPVVWASAWPVASAASLPTWALEALGATPPATQGKPPGLSGRCCHLCVFGVVPAHLDPGRGPRSPLLVGEKVKELAVMFLNCSSPSFQDHGPDPPGPSGALGLSRSLGRGPSCNLGWPRLWAHSSVSPHRGPLGLLHSHLPTPPAQHTRLLNECMTD